MSVLISTIGALSSFYPEAKGSQDYAGRRFQIIRLLAKMPTIAAWSYRSGAAGFRVYPDNDLSYTGNFLSMIKRMSEPKYKLHPILERALDVLFIPPRRSRAELLDEHDAKRGSSQSRLLFRR